MLREFENIEMMKSKNTEGDEKPFSTLWKSEFSGSLASEDDQREMLLYKALRSAKGVKEVAEVCAHFWYSFSHGSKLGFLRQRKGLHTLNEALGNFDYTLSHFPVFLKHEIGHQDKASDIHSLTLLMTASLRKQ